MEEVAKPKLAVEARIKEYLKGYDLATAGDVAEAVNIKLEMMLKEAAVRCKANGRKTVKPYDL